MPSPSISPVINQLETYITQYISHISTKDVKQVETLNTLNKIHKSLEKIQSVLDKSNESPDVCEKLFSVLINIFFYSVNLYP